MRGAESVCGCFPVGRHYPAIAEQLLRAEIKIVGLCSACAADAPWSEAALAILDLETTGLDPLHDRILEIGVIWCEGGVVSARHNWLVNPGIPVPEAARAVHGISDEDLASAPLLVEVVEEVAAALKNRVLVAYNASFDRSFLFAERDRLGLTALATVLREEVIWIDPLVWAREIHKMERSKKLGDVAQRLGIEIKQLHRACDDAEMTAQVLLAMAKDLPVAYGELIRLQSQYDERQKAERRRGPY